MLQYNKQTSWQPLPLLLKAKKPFFSLGLTRSDFQRMQHIVLKKLGLFDSCQWSIVDKPRSKLHDYGARSCVVTSLHQPMDNLGVLAFCLKVLPCSSTQYDKNISMSSWLKSHSSPQRIDPQGITEGILLIIPVHLQKDRLCHLPTLYLGLAQWLAAAPDKDTSFYLILISWKTF